MELSLELAGADGVFVPVASGAQFAVSSTTATTARWTVTNTTAIAQTGFYLFSYGPDCLLSGQTIAAHGTLTCTEVIAPESTEPVPTYGLANLGALAGLYDGTTDYPLAFPLTINIVDDSSGSSLTLDKATVDPDGVLTVAGSGFDAGDALTGILTSTPIILGPFTVTGSAFSSTVTLPSTLEAGVHTVTLYSNGVAYGSRTFTLLPRPGLAASGTDPTGVLVGGGLLLLGGLALVGLRHTPYWYTPRDSNPEPTD